MRRMLAIGGALVGLVFAGFATAGVVVTGDNNGTFTPGQSFVISVDDVLQGVVSPDLGGLIADNCIGPGQSAWTEAHGQFSVGLAGEGVTGSVPLTVACSGSAWEYSGGTTTTIPAGVGWTSAVVSVDVDETVPAYNGICIQPCLPVVSYNFSHTYPLVTPSNTSTSNTSPASTTQQNATTTSPAPTTTSEGTTSTAPPPTVTVTNPASTVTVTTSATTPPPVVTYIINVPSTITIQQTGNTITITISSNDRRSLQTLCWRPASATQSNCANSSHGVWRVTLRKTPGKRVFLLKAHGKVVARKTVNVRVKS